MASESVLKQKKTEVKDLAEKIKNAKVLILADYRGINVEDVTALRKKLREENSEYYIIKNNIIRRALAECKIEGLEEFLSGPTAVIIGNENYLTPAKVIYEFTKNHEFYKIKSAVIEGTVSSAEEIITLAQLPSREELLAKLAGSLLGNITKLAIGLDQVRVQKESA